MKPSTRGSHLRPTGPTVPVAVSELPVSLATASDDDLRELLQSAHLPTLLPALAAVTGDLSILRPHLRPRPVSAYAGLMAQGGLTESEQEEARAIALDALIAIRDGGIASREPQIALDDLRQLLEFMSGPVDDEYLPLLLHELGFPDDLGAPTWTKQELAPTRDFSVLVVGAGMSGIAVGHRLKQAGIPFTIVERRGDVGGVWLDNTYPGARLDTTNFNYSYSFAQTGEWPSQYSKQADILDYFRSVADKLDVRGHVRFETEYVEGSYDEASGTWVSTLRRPDGSTEQIRSNALIVAVGQLNEPKLPDFPGVDSFDGPSFHTAQWDHGIDLEGKRVAVVGTGSSAFQVFPQVAQIVAHVTVLQRTPGYVFPTPGYTEEMPTGLRWLFQHVPQYHRWYRYGQFWMSVDGVRDFSLVDPTWKHPISVSEKNEQMRQFLVKYIEDSFADRPDLVAQLVPDYPPYAKRSLRDDGTWVSALKQDNVTLTSAAIERVLPQGILTADGVLHEVDVIIYGTGFKASQFLRTMKLHGRDGADLHEQWAGDARTFWGGTVPGFPNLFILYGPNTNLNTHGSAVLFSEATVEYVLDCLRLLLATDHASMEVREEPFLAHNQKIDTMMQGLSLGVSTVNTWYRNELGRISQNWPDTTTAYWAGTHGLRADDYTLR